MTQGVRVPLFSLRTVQVLQTEYLHMTKLTLSEVARRLGIHRTTAARMVGRNEIPAIRLPSGAVRVDEAEFQTWLASHRTLQLESAPMKAPIKLSAHLEQLEHEIALAERAIADAVKKDHAAGVELARAPSNHDSLKAAREAAQLVAALNADLDVLRKARIAAAEADNAEAQEAARAKAIEHMTTLETLLAERREAAERIDSVLADFKAAMSAWRDLGRSIAEEAGGFFKLTLDGRRLHECHGGASAMVDAALNPLAAEIDDALHGINSHLCMNFNYIRHAAGQPELVAVAADSSGNVLRTRVREIARQRGLLQ